MGKKTKARLSRTIPEIGSVSSAKTVWMRCGELYECIHVAQFNRNWEKCQRKWRNFVIFTRAKSKRINLIICSCLGRKSVVSNISSFSHRASTFDLREKSLMWKCFLQSPPLAPIRNPTLGFDCRIYWTHFYICALFPLLSHLRILLTASIYVAYIE